MFPCPQWTYVLVWPCEYCFGEEGGRPFKSPKAFNPDYVGYGLRDLTIKWELLGFIPTVEC